MFMFLFIVNLITYIFYIRILMMHNKNDIYVYY